MKNRVLVELCDKQYTITTDESEAYVKILAGEVNKLINDTIYRNIRISKIDATLLICLDLCDKKAKLAETNDNMRKEITTYVDEIEKLKKKLSRYEQLMAEAAEKSEPAINSEDTDKDKDGDNRYNRDNRATNKDMEIKVNKDDRETAEKEKDEDISNEEIQMTYPARPAYTPPAKDRERERARENESNAEQGKSSVGSNVRSEGIKLKASEQSLASVESLKERWRKIERK